jgi:hypothetical protein
MFAIQLAHGLAKEATRCISDRIWLENTPTCISHIVNLGLFLCRALALACLLTLFE